MSENIKKTINTHEAANAFCRAVVDDVRDTYQLFLVNLKGSSVIKKESLPESFSDQERVALTVFIFSLELLSIQNLFEKELADKLASLSVDCLSDIMGINKDLLLQEIAIYQNKFIEDTKAGINPFDSLGVMTILAESLNIKKTQEFHGAKYFSVAVTDLLALFCGGLMGKWKKLSEKFNIMND